MSNPALDRAAQLVAQRRATGELAMLDGPEHHLVDEALKLAPELDPATIGAAWMMLGDILGRFATELPDAFPGSTLAILAQLAGQRLYTGTDVPREMPCPVVRSNGSPCPFTAKAVTPDLIDAQMRGHYATYHETLTWAPECGGAPSEFVAAIGFTQPCRLPRGHAEPCRHGQARDRAPLGVRVTDYPRPETDMHGRALGPGKCARCGEEKPQFNVFAWGGFLCEECVQALAIGLPELPEGATFTPLPEKPTPHEFDGILATLDGEYAPPAHERQACKHCERADAPPFIRYAEGGFACAPCALRRGEATVNQVRQVYGFAPIDDPECDEPLPMSPSARATVAEALAANGASLDDALRYGVATEQEIRERIAGDGGAIVKCERCTDPVVVREGGGTDGVLCQRCVAADGA